MKKLFFTLLILTLSVGSTFAQLSSMISVTNAATSVTGGYATGYPLIARATITNLTQGTIRLMMHRKVISSTAGTDNNFCWGINCYPPNISLSPNALVLSGTAVDNSFQGDFTPNNIASSALIRYCVFEEGTSGDSICFNVTFDASSPSAIHSVKKAAVNRLETYPNPANNNLYFSYKLPSDNGKVTLLNTIGGVVYEADLRNSEGNATIQTSELTEGIYICKLSSEGKVVASKKVIVRH